MTEHPIDPQEQVEPDLELLADDISGEGGFDLDVGELYDDDGYADEEDDF